jgi:hypothetical protein
MRKKWLRLMRIAPLALLFAGTAFAQTTSTILGVVTDASTGKPVPGAVIIATSSALQGEQTAVTGNDGSYRITLLPPGEYKLAVQLEGFKPAERSDITLRTDKTIRANIAVVPEAVQMEEQVVRTGAAPVINIGAAESGAVVSREFVASIPVGRSVEQVSAVVPTASADFYGVGFAGAQSPENAYILDGMNVTDPVYGTFGGNTNTQTPQTSLLTNFVQEIDVKTGGFMPEYGRATGGILNMVTRSGSNEFHGSVFGNFTPRFLVQPDGETAGAAGEAVAWRQKPDEGAYDADIGFEIGGPIQKDKLWFYAGFAPVLIEKRTERFLRSNRLVSELSPAEAAQCVGEDPSGYGRCIRADGTYLQSTIANSSQIVDTGRTTYQFAGKLTYLLDENNNFTVSAFGFPSTTTTFSMNSASTRRKYDTDDNIMDVIGRYAGKFFDKRLIVEAVGGWHQSTTVDQPSTFQRNTSTLRYEEDVNLNFFEPNAECTSVEKCPVFQYATGGLGYLNDQRSNRLAGKLTGSYLFDALGSHAAKLGLDVERSDYKISKDYGGNAFLSVTPSLNRIRAFRSYGFVNDPSGETAEETGFNIVDAIENTSQTTSTAVYLQDSWQLPVANVTLNAGIRWEAQSMSNDTTDIEGFSINNNWAPRVQAIWDFTGNGRGKVAGSWGRFFYSIPLDMGDRAFGNEAQVRYQLDPAGCPAGANLSEAAPVLDATGITQQQCGLVERLPGLYGIQVGGTTPVHPDLQGVYVDQFGGQAEYELFSDLSVGVEYNGRRQGQTIEDMSPDDGGHYYIGNPGYGDDFVWEGPDGISGNADDVELSSKGVETFDPATGRSLQIAFPKPERSYDGFTLFARKNFSNSWQGAVSYTYSYLRGNLAGPFRSEDLQLDPGITSEYDLASLTANRFGRLPGDIPHQVKVFGSYNFNLGPRFNVSAGAAYTGASGNPVSVLGGHPDYGDGQAFILPRGIGGRSAFVHQLDARGSLEYVISPPYAIRFSVDVFNLLNTQEVRITDENYTYDAVQPIAGASCDTDAPSSGNPITTLQRDCPDLAYMKTVDGRPVTVNPNWGKAFPGTASFQIPLSLRFGVAMSF